MRRGHNPSCLHPSVFFPSIHASFSTLLSLAPLFCVLIVTANITLFCDTYYYIFGNQYCRDRGVPPCRKTRDCLASSVLGRYVLTIYYMFIEIAKMKVLSWTNIVNGADFPPSALISL